MKRPEQERFTGLDMRKYILIIYVMMGLTLLAGCRPRMKNALDDQQMLLLFSAAYLLNPCSGQLSPVLSSAQATSSLPAGSGSVTGRLLTTSGKPVVGALVIAFDGSPTPVFVGTHTSVNGAGTFFLSGAPAGPGYKLSVEPIAKDFYGRIDTQLDCFLSPASFVSGYYNGAGNTVVSGAGSATTFAISSGGVTDLTGIYVMP